MSSERAYSMVRDGGGGGGVGGSGRNYKSNTKAELWSDCRQSPAEPLFQMEKRACECAP